MTESTHDRPMPELNDTDLVSPYTHEYAVEQLKKGDVERFLRWFKQGELALGEHPAPTERANFLLDVVSAYEDAEKFDEALVFMQRAEALHDVDASVLERIRVRAAGLRKMIAAQALRRGDLATYHMWVQTREHDMGPDVDPARKCDFIVDRATMHVSANDYAGAGELLKQAAAVIGGKDAEREKMILVLVGQFGTPEAAAEVKTILRRGIGEEIAKVQTERVAIQTHDFEWESRFESEDAWNRRKAELKELDQALANRKAALG